jgi:uncharacterized protein (TIGR03067 family)
MRLANSGFMLLAVAGFIAAAEPRTDDTKALKGNWQAVSIKAGGDDAPPDEVRKFTFSFTETTYTNTIDGQVVEEGGYTIDASTTPKTIDLDIKKGPDDGKKQLGVYRLDGDRLTIVAAQAGSTERPKSLKPKDAADAMTFVLDRVKR